MAAELTTTKLNAESHLLLVRVIYLGQCLIDLAKKAYS